ncbi:MAG TPA: CusA/CzcA family heavy metal efflux RND transporter, partial [Candidatus Binataceae bacterium]|nr:CusA/CzcA family heavy metal efflux RND transporter [Candidatus Binataceae bacterium]
FEVVDPQRSAMELRSILDWRIAPRLKEVPGVVEVNSFGGELKTYEVQINPEALVANKLTLSDVFQSLKENNLSAGGGYIIHNGEQQVIRGAGLVTKLSDIGNIVVRNHNGAPIYIRNLGNVAFAPMLRQGAVTHDGKGETVAGIVMLLIGENSRTVVDRVKAKIQEIQPTLPKGIQIVPYYDRAELIRRTINTVAHNLAEGAILVGALLFLFLGDIRASLIVASVIPLSMLAAFIGMNWMGVSGNLMSLGAIDFGLIVDGSVVMIENIFHRLERDQQGSMAHRVFEAGREVLRPIVFAIGIIIVVYLPILSFEEVEGKMFRPMALTVIFALAGSLLFALTYVPVMASVFLKSTVPHEPWIVRHCNRIHERLRRITMKRPRTVVMTTAAIFAISLLAAPFLGTEFIPTLDEGVINLDVMQLPSISLEQAIANSTEAEKALLEIPEVTRVISRIGRPEIATAPNGPDESDVYVFLKPKEQWQVSSKDELVKQIQHKIRDRVPGMAFGISQPIEGRINDMISGIKADVAIHVYGDNLQQMMQVGQKMMAVLGSIPGAADLKMIPRTGLPSVNVEIDRAAVARYGINASDVLAAVQTIGGHVVGQVVEGQARFPLQVRFEETARRNLDQLGDISVAAPDGALIPLAQLAHISVSEGPVSVWRNNLSRRITVAANVRGTDLGSFVGAAKAAIAQRVEVPQGWWLEWGGQYENLQRASHRLMILVPAALMLILVLLYNTFSSMRMALLIFGNVLLGASGGIFALIIRGLAFSITAGVGFITLSGVSVLNGVVLVSEINRLREAGRGVNEAVISASRDRLRPILMASLVALFGFIPMAISHGAGAEVQRPLASVVIGGLLTSLPFTLYVIPVLYRWLAEPAAKLPVNNS